MAYFIPTLYVIISYTFFLLLRLFQSSAELKFILFVLPFIMGLVNFIVVVTVGRKWTKETLLNCTLIIKYGLIPFYLIGGLYTVGVTILAIVPLPLMSLFGILTILFLIVGYEILLGAAPYAIAYLIKAYKDGTHSKGVAILSGICQFFFMFDVLSMMVLTLKERHLVKTTVFLLCAVGLIILAVVFCLAVLLATI